VSDKRPKINVVVTDLDNTLFDWVEIWSRSFDAMLRRLANDSGIERARLEQEFRVIHQKYGTSEYAFSIEELPSLVAKHRGENLAKRYEAAIDDYRKARRSAMHLYSGVFDTLMAIRSAGCLIVGYTESMAYYSNYRMRRLKLDGLLDYLYSPATLPPNLPSTDGTPTPCTVSVDCDLRARGVSPPQTRLGNHPHLTPTLLCACRHRLLFERWTNAQPDRIYPTATTGTPARVLAPIPPCLGRSTFR
jgi:phosphoglycolate phosphatase-like HAD superfamily hydrolase